MARVKQIIGWTAIVLFAATLVGIWVLTEQNAVETSLLSESTARVVEGQATGVQAADATGEAQTENGMTGGTDSAASNVRSGRLASIRMWVGTNVRRVAHTVEFFFVGLFASVIVACFSRRPWSVCSRCVPVLLFCAACSVGDQVHKIFVPGRHFDVIDLGFDAAGYITACCWYCWQRRWCAMRLGRSAPMRGASLKTRHRDCLCFDIDYNNGCNRERSSMCSFPYTCFL